MTVDFCGKGSENNYKNNRKYFFFKQKRLVLCLKIPLWSLVVAVLVCVGGCFVWRDGRVCLVVVMALCGGVCALVCKRYGLALRKVWFCRAKGNLLEGERYGFGKPSFFGGWPHDGRGLSEADFGARKGRVGNAGRQDVVRGCARVLPP